MSLLFTNIATLVTHVPGEEELANAAIVIENGTVAWIGPDSATPAADEVFDVNGGTVIPGFVDSHTHLVHAGDRAKEFEARMAGTEYSAGGIRTTVMATRAASDDELRAQTNKRVQELIRGGTTTWETKSGYGLSVDDEQRISRVGSEFTSETTFLGAHVVPEEFASNRDAYVDLVKTEMLDACLPFSKWIDVFCDRGAFTEDEAEEILTAGSAKGLGLRMHANQLSMNGGVQLAIALGAASVDHCTHLSDADIAALAGSDTVATLVPAAEFSTRSSYPSAKRLLEAGATVALATDCNPGSSFTTSMAFCIALAVREMHMTPYQALWSATQGGAHALRRSDIGHLSIGASAHLTVLTSPSYIHLAYRPGVDLVRAVYRDGFHYERSNA